MCSIQSNSIVYDVILISDIRQVNKSRSLTGIKMSEEQRSDFKIFARNGISSAKAIEMIRNAYEQRRRKQLCASSAKGLRE